MAQPCEEKKNDRFNRKGNLLIADQYNGRIVETSPTGEIVWFFGLGPNDSSANSLLGTNDATRIPGEYTLAVGTGYGPNVTTQFPLGLVDNRTVIISKEKSIVWQYGQFGVTGAGPNELNTPVQAIYLPCKCHKSRGNPLKCFSVVIVDQGNQRLIRVNTQGVITWTYPDANTPIEYKLNNPNSVERLRNGNYLISDEGNSRVLEIDPHHGNAVVKVYTASGTLQSAAFASRLPNGNTLITDATASKVVEVNPDDNIVWQYITNAEFNSIANPQPSRAVRLHDGDTLISNQYNNEVLRIGKTSAIKEVYGLPLNGALIPPNNIFNNNVGFSIYSTQLGLYGPYSAYVIKDETGLTKP
jgi:hypothetical protein